MLMSAVYIYYADFVLHLHYIRRSQKWQYRREKYLRQEEIRDAAMFGSLISPDSQSAPSAANTIFPTEFAETARLMQAKIIPQQRLKKHRHNPLFAVCARYSKMKNGKERSLLLLFFVIIAKQQVPVYCENVFSDFRRDILYHVSPLVFKFIFKFVLSEVDSSW